MFDFVRCTHNGTGGASSVTLAKMAGYPQPTNAVGTTGTRRVSYVIAEYTDATKSVLAQSERGRGVLTLSTNVLTRDEIGSTWVDGTPGTYNVDNPTALTFSNTAANIDIMLTVTSVSSRPALPAMHNVTSLINEPYSPSNTRIQIDGTSAVITLSAGSRYYIPCEYAYAKPITTIAVKAPSITTTGNVRVSVFEWGADGLPGSLIKEFTASSQIGINTSTGIKSLTLATPFWLPPGWYFFMIQADAAVQLLQATPSGHCGIGSLNDRDAMYFVKSSTYGAAPSPADTTFTSITSRSGGGQPVVYIK